MGSRIPFYQNGQLVGYAENGVYFTERKSTVHFFRRFQGYGISMIHLHQFFPSGVRLVRLTEHRKDGSAKVWWSYVDSWFRHGQKWNNEGDDQRILPMSFMWEDGKDPPKELEMEVGKQATLFSAHV